MMPLNICCLTWAIDVSSTAEVVGTLAILFFFFLDNMGTSAILVI